MSDAAPREPFRAAWDARTTTDPAPLPVPTASDRSCWAPGGTAHEATISHLADRATDRAGHPWPATPATAYLRYRRDGDRDTYETRVSDRQRRLSLAAVAAAATLDDDRIDEVVDGVVVLCEQSSWCWPAHDDATTVSGFHLPDPRRPYLDLGAGEVVAQLAWIDRLLGPWLDRRAPGLRERIRHEAHLRIFEPFLTRQDWHWLGTEGDVHNWNPWIHGNLVVAAVALADDPATRDEVIGSALTGIDRYVRSLPADGAIDEGCSYWWNGACRALETACLLRDVYPGLGVDVAGGLGASLDFPRRMHLGGPWYASFGDARARPEPDAPWHALFRASRVFGSRDGARFAASRRPRPAPVATETEGLGRLLLALCDPDWHDADPTPPDPEPVVWFGSVQVGVARTPTGAVPAGRRGLSVVVKGGHNGEHHNHLDIGSVIVAVGGTPLVIDPGRPTYTSQTFSDRRYELWIMGSGWHGVPAVCGLEQGIGPGFRAAGESRGHDDGATWFSLDLGAAYPTNPVGGWRRTVRLDHGSRLVTIDDTWEGVDLDVPTRWRCILAGTVDQEGGTLRTRAVDGAGAVLRWDPDLAAEVEIRHLEDPMLTSAWGPALSRLTVTIPHTADRDRFTLTIGEVV